MNCILCVSTSDQIIHIFDKDGICLNIKNIITKHFWLQPNAEDVNSKVICSSCWNTLESFHKFYQKVEDAHVRSANVKPPIEADLFTADSKLESGVPQVKRSKRSKLTKEITTAKQLIDSVPNTRPRRKNVTNAKSDPKTAKPNVKRKIASNVQNLTMKRVPCHDFDPKHFKCDKCGKILSSNTTLKNHMRTHINQCKKCKKSFPRKEQLARHVRTHLKLKKICKQCRKVCRGENALRQHELWEHLNVPRKRVKCHECGVDFAENSSLYTHMDNLHPKPRIEVIHRCNICEKILASSDGLKQHIKYVHILERVHKCSMCEKAFKTAQTLREHTTTHTGEVLYTCSYCPKTFNSNGNMYAHRKKMHPEEWEAYHRRMWVLNAHF